MFDKDVSAERLSHLVRVSGVEMHGADRLIRHVPRRLDVQRVVIGSDVQGHLPESFGARRVRNHQLRCELGRQDEALRLRIRLLGIISQVQRHLRQPSADGSVRVVVGVEVHEELRPFVRQEFDHVESWLDASRCAAPLVRSRRRLAAPSQQVDHRVGFAEFVDVGGARVQRPVPRQIEAQGPTADGDLHVDDSNGFVPQTRLRYKLARSHLRHEPVDGIRFLVTLGEGGRREDGRYRHPQGGDSDRRPHGCCHPSPPSPSGPRLRMRVPAAAASASSTGSSNRRGSHCHLSPCVALSPTASPLPMSAAPTTIATPVTHLARCPPTDATTNHLSLPPTRSPINPTTRQLR